MAAPQVSRNHTSTDIPLSPAKGDGVASSAYPVPENRTQSHPKTVQEILEQLAQDSPEKVAVVDNSQIVTFSELNARAAAVAGTLQAEGVGRETVVGICVSRSLAFVVGALGVMKAGGAYLPLDPSYPFERLNFQLTDSGASLVMMEASEDATAWNPSARQIGINPGGRLTVNAKPSCRPASLDPSSLAYIIYTSGSTGKPKGVEITHDGLTNLVEWHQQAFGVTPKDKASAVSTVGFDALVWELWGNLCAGAAIQIADAETVREPAAMRDWLVANGITISFSPTPLAEKLLGLEWPAHSKLRILLAGGDLLHKRPPKNLPFRVFNNYGLTECTVVSASCEVFPEPSNGLPPIGRPISNTSLYLLDDQIRPVQPGEEGEIWITGRGIGRGYRNSGESQANRFVPNLSDFRSGERAFRTGDRGRILPDGEMAITGREDNQISIRGYRIEPAEVEAALDNHVSVRESAVIAIENSAGEKRLVAVLSGEFQGTTEEEIRAFLSQQLPGYMIPHQFICVDELPLSDNGKVDREGLRTGAIDGFPLRTNLRPVAPRDELECQLKRIWDGILGISTPGIQADFFHLGGDSLMAVGLFSQIESEFEIVLPISTLFETRTIEGLAKVIRQRKSKSPHSSVVSVKRSGKRVPLYCVHNHTGDVLFCRRFPDYLPVEQPLYGIESTAAHGEEPDFTVEEMAARYVDELRNMQRHGPYRLFGFCFGGLVAFEMAGLLRAKGAVVDFLGMFNTPAPGSLKGWPLSQGSYLANRVRDELAKTSPLGGTEKFEHLLRNGLNLPRAVIRSLRTEALRPLGKSPKRKGIFRALKSLVELGDVNVAAAKNYIPQRLYDGTITFFVSDALPYRYRVPADSGWSPYAAGGVEFVRVVPSAKESSEDGFARTVCERLATLPAR